MKELYRCRIKKAVALLLPIVLFLVIAQNFLFSYNDRNTDRIRRFYNEEPNSLDVVFLGASEVLAGFAPGYAYDQCGFTSYMYAIDSNTGSLYTPQLKEVLSCQNPQVVFVEVFGFLRGGDTELADESRLRIFTESIPMSRNKLETIMEYPYENKISCFFPFLKYHGNLGMPLGNVEAALKDPMFLDKKAPSTLKGITTITEIYEGPGDAGNPNDEFAATLSADALNYLTDFLEYCKAENLQNVVFVNFPRYLLNEEQHDLPRLVDQVEEIVKGYGFQLLDLQNEKETIGIDHETDFYNSHHLNVYGQMKLTEYIGDLVINGYGIVPLDQSPESKAQWETAANCTTEYFEMAKRAIEDGQKLEIYEDHEIWFARKEN